MQLVVFVLFYILILVFVFPIVFLILIINDPIFDVGENHCSEIKMKNLGDIEKMCEPDNEILALV